jgi:hypothetical protein
MPVGQTLQTAHSCGPTGNATLCALQRWQDWKVTRENGTVPHCGDRWTVDDTNYPQIHWIAAAANGTPFGFADLFGSALPPAMITFIESLVDKHDSDGVVAVSSALAPALDACYPFTRTPRPLGGDGASVAPVTRTYGGANYATAHCHHPGAAVDPRYADRDELTGVGHSLRTIRTSRTSFGRRCVAMTSGEGGCARCSPSRQPPRVRATVSTSASEL